MRHLHKLTNNNRIFAERLLCRKFQCSGGNETLFNIEIYSLLQSLSILSTSHIITMAVRRSQLAAFSWMFIQYENKDRRIKSKTIQGSLEEGIISQRGDKCNNSILSNSQEQVRLQRKERKSENLWLPLKTIIRRVWL